MKKKTKIPRVKIPSAIVMSQIELSQQQTRSISAVTPAEFIKERIGRGGKKMKYIEGGYVISRLNEAFSPGGWEFDVIQEWIEPKEVFVKGKLTIKDHKNGYTVSKTQYGQSDRQEKGVPLGDTVKAATTDALKKCASMIGIGLDVYWNQLDQTRQEQPKVEPRVGEKDMFEKAMTNIKKCGNVETLRQILKNVIHSNLYTESHKNELILLLRSRIDEF